MNKAFIYGHHFKYLKPLIDNATAYVVYEHLFDEYMRLYRNNHLVSFSFDLPDINNISALSGVRWVTVNSALEKLQAMNLLKIDKVEGKDKRQCALDMYYCLSAVDVFYRLPPKDKPDFKKAFKSGDVDAMKALGFSVNTDDVSECLEMYGAPMLKEADLLNNEEGYAKLKNPMQNCITPNEGNGSLESESPMQNCIPYAKLHNPIKNCRPLYEDAETYAKLKKVMQNCIMRYDERDSINSDEPMQNCIPLLKIEEPYAKLHNPTLCKNEEGYAKLNNLMQNYIGLTRSFVDNFVKNCTKEHFIELFSDTLMQFCTTPEELNSLVDRIWEGKSDDRVPFMFLLAFTLCKIAYPPMQNCITVIIYNNIKQQEEYIINNATSLSPKRSSQEKGVTFLSSTAERKDNQKKEGYTENSRFPSDLGHVEILPLGNFPGDEQEGKGETDEEVDEGRERRKRLRERASTSQNPIDKKYELIRKRRRLPYFPAEEAKEIITNLPACLDRVDKIFINQVWEILKELFVEDEYDEDGNYVGEKEVNPEGQVFEKERLYKDVLKPAYESVLNIFEKGGVEYKGVLLPVTSKDKPFPEMVDLIIDWEESGGLEEVYYKITSATFHNMYAKELEEIRIDRNVARKYRYRDIEYTRKILEIMAKEKNKPEILTPAEYAVGRFLMDNFNITDTFDPIVPKNIYAGRNYNRAFFANMENKVGISKEDFLGLLFREKMDENEMIRLGFRMFFSKHIENWNKKYGFKSTINLPEEVKWSDEQIAAYDKIVAVAEEEAEKEEKKAQEAK